MTEADFISSGFSGFHCEFTFKNGTIVTGVIAHFLYSLPFGSYQLVTTNNMVEFKRYMDARDEVNMRKLCIQINLEDIKGAVRLGW